MRGGPFGRGGEHGGGSGGRHGFGDDGRIGRFLMQGDLRLLVLALIAEEPRHGYEIIKHIEELTGGFYAPSPGVIYPTLTFLDEAGYVSAEADGNKKRYAITDDGRRYLGENKRMAAVIRERLSALAERARRHEEGHRGRRAHRGQTGPELPASLEAALHNLREVIGRRLAADPAGAAAIVKKLLETADQLEAPPA